MVLHKSLDNSGFCDSGLKHMANQVKMQEKFREQTFFAIDQHSSQNATVHSFVFLTPVDVT